MVHINAVNTPGRNSNVLSIQTFRSLFVPVDRSERPGRADSPGCVRLRVEIAGGRAVWNVPEPAVHPQHQSNRPQADLPRTGGAFSTRKLQLEIKLDMFSLNILV